MSLSEISKMVGLHKSTTAGIINTLKAEGFIEQSESDGKLRLGLSLFSLAVQARRGLVEICEPHLNKLLELTGETVNLAIFDISEIVYIAKKECTHSIRIITSVGSRLPVYCTAIGKVILAFMERSKVETIIDSINLTPLTEYTITDREELFKALDSIAKEGVAYDLEEFQEGLICVASPLFHREGDIAGAISISGPVSRLGQPKLSEVADILREITSKICVELVRCTR